MNINLVKELRDISGAGMMDCKKALEETNANIEEALNWLREKGISKALKKADRIAAEGLSTILVENNNAVILEINCETDFVSKADKFRDFVQAIADALLNSDAKTIEEAYKVQMEEDTIEEALINITSVIGEKISFRRFKRVTKTSSQTFGSYIHMGGKISVLITLEGGNEIVAKDVAMHAAATKPEYVAKEEVPAEVLEKEKEILKEQAINEGKAPEIAEKMVLGRISKFYKDVCLNEQDFVKDNSITVSKYVENSNAKIVEMIRYEVGEGIEKRSDNFAEEVAKQANI